MSTCKRIQSIIDAAEQPSALPFEATSHLTACAPCQSFADGRARLRSLLGEMPRISAPVGFDARLKARMGEARAPKTFFGFGPAAYARLGTAAAVLVISVFAAQYSGLISLTGTQGSGTTPTVARVDPPGAGATDNGEAQANPVAPSPIGPSVTGKDGAGVGRASLVAMKSTARGGRNVSAASGRTDLEPESEEMYVPMVMVRGNNGTASVPMLPVSVGAQQRMMVRSGGVAATPVGVSF